MPSATPSSARPSRLRDAGLPCPIVSVGSTPTAFAATDLAGVTEVRAGTYVFLDAVMAGLGICAVEEIALSVVVTVIGHQREKGWILTDGGWMAMSADHGDDGYGPVADLAGSPLPGLAMTGATRNTGSSRAAARHSRTCRSAPAARASAPRLRHRRPAPRVRGRRRIGDDRGDLAARRRLVSSKDPKFSIVVRGGLALPASARQGSLQTRRALRRRERGHEVRGPPP